MNDLLLPRVRNALEAVEREYGVTVLYACESGSRAWGFASRDSDYDVRFLYAHHRDWYLSVDERRDVIEKPIEDDLDVSGWDLRKSLRLLRKSNPPLLEWLRSPVVYRSNTQFAAEFSGLAERYYSRRRCFAHYLHMAEGNWLDYLRGREEVSLKKYLYVLRPVLACRWIEHDLGPVPMRFDELVEHVLDDAEVRKSVHALLAQKRRSREFDRGPTEPVLHRFLTGELARLALLPKHEEAPAESSMLDRFFQRWVAEESTVQTHGI